MIGMRRHLSLQPQSVSLLTLPLAYTPSDGQRLQTLVRTSREFLNSIPKARASKIGASTPRRVSCLLPPFPPARAC